MDYEDFLVELNTPLKSIELLSEIIYDKANNDWELLSKDTKREHFDELIALNHLIGLSAKELLNFRQTEIESIIY